MALQAPGAAYPPIHSHLPQPVPWPKSYQDRLARDRPGEDNSFMERSHRTDNEEFYRLEKRGLKDLSLRDPVGKDFMLKASEWIWYYNYDRSHDGLGGPVLAGLGQGRAL